MNILDNFHKDISGWYKPEEIKEIFNAAISINTAAEKEKRNGMSIADINYEDLNIFIIFKDDINQNIVDIKCSKYLLNTAESNILSEAIATALMNLNGLVGNYSINKLQQIIEAMEEENNSHSNWCSENDW